MTPLAKYCIIELFYTFTKFEREPLMTVSILVDIIIAAIIVFGAVIGITRGFVATVAKPVKWFAAIALSVSLCVPAADSIVQPMIEEPITNQISDYVIEKCTDITADNANEKLPTLLKISATLVGLDISHIAATDSESFVTELVRQLSEPATHLISVIISFFAIYFISKILLGITVLLINKIFEGGVFGALNKVLGFIFSTTFAFIIAWALTSIFGYVINLSAFSDVAWIKDFNGGFIYKFFKSISPIDILLSF